MDLTVVTAVRDDPLLGNAIESVPPDIEHVVAMTRPPESTRETVRRLAAGRPRLRALETARAGMSPGINLGVAAATHEKIVVLDSDCTLTRRTLEAYSDALDRAAFVRGKTICHRAGGWSQFAGLGQSDLNRPRLIGPSIAFRKTPFLELGGYDEQIIGSCDHEYVLRIEDRGIPTIYEPEAEIWHQPVTFRVDRIAHLGYGRGMRYIDTKRGGFYGLHICLLRWYPTTLWHKAVTRGPASVVRSLVMGAIMLVGYVDQIVNRRYGRL
jgi:GT2 family glycosyltransferase